ncbi:DUF190 domain-containing protein [Jiangella anatolica]|uniref:Uncharacterized protein n=1 Tax=Jiangella anatolica TaxID=2670374 RepID=A0A2W2BEP5_9ACTN|nr:DUF190 domain-containing protein [Jiangella anatolica]PZF86081.1 hypothetical protein C1I92_02565 [Jiangella anatolica]
MELSGPAVRASIFIGEDDTWHHQPLYHEIVKRARAAGLAGATVLRGSEGFGTSSMIHTTRILDLTEDLPIVVLLIDTAEAIQAFLPELDELITEGTVVLDDVQVLRYEGRPRP